MKSLTQYIKESYVNEAGYRTAARAYKANHLVQRQHAAGETVKKRPNGREDSNWDRLQRSDKLRCETLTSAINEKLPNLTLNFYRGNGNGKGALRFTFDKVKYISKLQVEKAKIRLEGVSSFDGGKEYRSCLDLDWQGYLLVELGI